MKRYISLLSSQQHISSCLWNLPQIKFPPPPPTTPLNLLTRSVVLPPPITHLHRKNPWFIPKVEQNELYHLSPDPPHTASNPSPNLTP